MLDDGRIIAISPKPEPLLKVTHTHLPHCMAHRQQAYALPDLNRITPIQQDHVLEDMLRLLGAQIEKQSAPFTPEGGAYGHGRTHGHEHTHDGGHDHA